MNIFGKIEDFSCHPTYVVFTIPFVALKSEALGCLDTKRTSPMPVVPPIHDDSEVPPRRSRSSGLASRHRRRNPPLR